MTRKITYSGILLLILAILFNINWLNSSALGLVAGIFYLLIFGFYLGRLIFRHNSWTWQLWLGIFSLLSLYSLTGAIIYLIYQLNTTVISLLFLIISGLISYFYLKISLTPKIKFKFPKFQKFNLILIATYLFLYILSLWLLWQSRTDTAINSPWQVIPAVFFFIYFLLTINLILLIFYNKNYLTSIFIALHFLLSTSIALVIYKLGFGFDPFIHQATEQAIFSQGVILPKPFYYLGQYSIIIFLSQLLQTSITLIDKLLVPILSAIFLPYIIYQSLRQSFNWPKATCRLLSLSFLWLPFSLFIVTTPQALANLFVITVLLLSLAYLKNRSIPFYFLLGLAFTAAAIHALAGLPILIYLFFVWLITHKTKFKKIIITIISLPAAIALPAALMLNSIISTNKIRVDWSAGLKIFSWPDIYQRQFNFFLDLAYLYKNSIYWLVLVIALCVFIYSLKQKKGELFTPAILLFAILTVNGILLRFIKLNDIIAYEQTEFAVRVSLLSFYFLLPLFIYGLYIIFTIARNNYQAKFFISFLISGCLLSALYISYPRFDNYENSKFINLSQSDFDTVNFIDSQAGQDYIVLANQMTAAAALKTFGFGRYYNQQYFYPIPTGGQLYSYYEKMINEDPERAIITEAMDLTQVNQVYFVLPKYLERSAKIAEKARSQAQKIWLINDQIYIFKYSR